MIRSTQSHLKQDITYNYHILIPFWGTTSLGTTVTCADSGLVGTVFGGSSSVGFGFFNSKGT